MRVLGVGEAPSSLWKLCTRAEFELGETMNKKVTRRLKIALLRWCSAVRIVVAREEQRKIEKERIMRYAPFYFILIPRRRKFVVELKISTQPRFS